MANDMHKVSLPKKLYTVIEENVRSFVDGKGSAYKFNVKSNEFAIVSKDGYVITYFKSTKGYDYYLAQKKARKK